MSRSTSQNANKSVGKNAQSIAPASQSGAKTHKLSPLRTAEAKSYSELHNEKHSASSYREKQAARRVGTNQTESYRGRDRSKSNGSDRQDDYDGKSKSDTRINSGRYEQFMHSWHMKKQQLMSGHTNHTDQNWLESTYNDDSFLRRNENLNLMGVSVEDILKSKGSIYDIPPKTFSIETLGYGNHALQHSSNQTFNNNNSLRHHSPPHRQANNDENSLFNINEGGQSSPSELFSPSPNFSKNLNFTSALQIDTSTIEPTLQNRSYVAGELEIELLKAKKDVIIVEEKLKTKDDEITELRNCLEEAHSQLIKAHELRDNDLKKMKQLEDRFIQQKRNSQTLEQELQNSINTRSFPSPLEEAVENLSFLESYQIVRLLKQDRALLRGRVDECCREIEIHKHRNETLRKEMNELLLNKHNRASQRGQNLNEVEHILTNYAQEVEDFRNMKHEADSRIQKLLDEFEERGSQFEKEFEEERRKTQQLRSETEAAISEREKLQTEINKLQEEQKTKSQALKEYADKINEAINELAKENKHYRKQIKILSKDRGVKERIEYLDAYYKQQLHSVAKEREVLRERLKNSGPVVRTGTASPAEKNRTKGSPVMNSIQGSNTDRSHEEMISPRRSTKNHSMKSKENVFPQSPASHGDSSEEEKKHMSVKTQNMLNEELLQLRRKLEEAQARILKLNQERENEKERGRDKDDRRSSNELVESLEMQIKSLQGEIEDLRVKAQKSSQMYEERLKAANSLNETLRAENISLVKESNSGTNELRSHNRELQEELKAIQKTFKQEFSKVAEEMAFHKKNSEELVVIIKTREDAIKQREDLLRQKDGIIKQGEEMIKQKEATIKELENQIQKFKEKKSNEKDVYEDLERQTVAVEKQRAMLIKQNEKIDELKEAIDKQEKDMEELEAQRGGMHEKLAEKEEIIDASNKQISSLIEQVTEAMSKEQSLLNQIKILKKNQK